MADDADDTQGGQKLKPEPNPAESEDHVDDTQNEQRHQPESSLIESNQTAPLIRSFIANIKRTEVVQLLLTAILVLTTIYYAKLTARSVKVSAEMAMLMRQANEINYRPYVQIEGVQAARIEQLAARSERDANLLKTTKPGGFIITQSPEGEEHILYSARNLGQIPAHDIKHFVEIYVIDEENRVEHLSPEQTLLTVSETLFPNQISNRQIRLGKSVIIRNDQKTKSIKVKLKITYFGNRDLDPNTYFYSLTLHYKPAISLEALSEEGTIIIEESDEGKVRAL